MTDKPTWRVVALIVLLIAVAAALRGYLPARDRMTHAEPGSSRAALVFIVVALSATLTLLAVAVIARLRDPRAAAPKTSDLSDMLGTGMGRPSWRVVLIGLGVIIAWLADCDAAGPIVGAAECDAVSGQPGYQHGPVFAHRPASATAAPAKQQRGHVRNSAGQCDPDDAAARCRDGHQFPTATAGRERRRLRR